MSTKKANATPSEEELRNKFHKLASLNGWFRPEKNVWVKQTLAANVTLPLPRPFAEIQNLIPPSRDSSSPTLPPPPDHPSSSSSTTVQPTATAPPPPPAGATPLRRLKKHTAASNSEEDENGASNDQHPGNLTVEDLSMLLDDDGPPQQTAAVAATVTVAVESDMKSNDKKPDEEEEEEEEEEDAEQEEEDDEIDGARVNPFIDGEALEGGSKQRAPEGDDLERLIESGEGVAGAAKIRARYEEIDAAAPETGAASSAEPTPAIDAIGDPAVPSSSSALDVDLGTCDSPAVPETPLRRLKKPAKSSSSVSTSIADDARAVSALVEGLGSLQLASTDTSSAAAATTTTTTSTRDERRNALQKLIERESARKQRATAAKRWRPPTSPTVPTEAEDNTIVGVDQRSEIDSKEQQQHGKSAADVTGSGSGSGKKRLSDVWLVRDDESGEEAIEEDGEDGEDEEEDDDEEEESEDESDCEEADLPKSKEQEIPPSDETDGGRTMLSPAFESPPKDLKAPSTAAERRAFAQNREQFASELFAEYNREVFGGALPTDTPVQWTNQMKTTAGRAKLKRLGSVYSAIIELEVKIVDCYGKLRNTLLHEMCHVAAWIIDHTSTPPHGAAFKKWAHAGMRRYPDLRIATCHNYQIEYKHKWECVDCGHVFGRHSKSIREQSHRCTCGGQLRYVPRTNKDGSVRKAATANPYTSFLKEHYAQTKRDHPGSCHRDILLLLRAEYNARKCANA